MDKKITNLKISKILIGIGAVVFTLGVICLITSIITYKQAYDAWHDAWWNQHTADLNDEPSVGFIIISVFITIIGFVTLINGARPYLSKLALKRHKETLEYIGNEITDIGTKAVDIGKPIHDKVVDEIVIPTANKKIDKVIVPAVKKVKRAIFDDEENSDNKMMYCRHCGKEILEDSKFCNHCGGKQ